MVVELVGMAITIDVTELMSVERRKDGILILPLWIPMFRGQCAYARWETGIEVMNAGHYHKPYAYVDLIFSAHKSSLWRTYHKFEERKPPKMDEVIKWERISEP